MELHQLRYALAVAETGGFSAAAKRCHVAQPSLSQQIRKLEDELGTPLFDRIARGAVPTEAGKRFLPYARQVITSVEEARRRVLDADDAPAGALAIGVIPTVAPYLLPRAVARYHKKYPAVALQLEENVTEVLIERLLSGAIDLAVLASPVEHDVLHAEPLMEEKLLVALPAQHPLGKRKRIRLSDLETEPLVLLHEMHCLGRQTAAICRRLNHPTNVAFIGSQLATLQQMVGLGVGVSLIPAMAAVEDTSKRRVYRELTGTQVTRTIVAAWHLHRFRTQAARAMQAELTSLGPDGG